MPHCCFSVLCLERTRSSRFGGVRLCRLERGIGHVAQSLFPSSSQRFALVASSVQDSAKSGKEQSVVEENRARFRLSFGEQARTVVQVCKTGTLCTSSVEHDDTPFGSHVDYILDDFGRPIVLLAQNAAHMRNLRKSQKCSLFCQPVASSGQSGCRATLVGFMVKLPLEQVSEVMEAYIDTHPHAAIALKYPEFSFYRMEVCDVYFVGGYGVAATWVDPKEYISSEPDPLAFQSQDLLKLMNSDHMEDLLRFCNVFLHLKNIEQCEIVMVDRLGFDMRVQLSETDIREYRIGFREHVVTSLDAQSALVQAMQEAWELENGYEKLWSEETPRPAVLYYSLSN
ncbi:Glutamyl-tRNA reductase-binding protein, chloroplastic [Galdieria sulphuraria]|nr:Glutamyl-tRNA reductase-binding protein, chloroplastic [Galdieria sulphuraria]